jgi:hypothetical protein
MTTSLRTLTASPASVPAGALLAALVLLALGLTGCASSAASADISRAVTETQVGQDSNDPDQKLQARSDTRSAQQSKDVADARLRHAEELAASRAAQFTAAERKVDLMTEKVYAAKLQALIDAGVPAAGKYDRDVELAHVAAAQRALDSALATAAEAERVAAAAAEQWQPSAKEPPLAALAFASSPVLSTPRRGGRPRPAGSPQHLASPHR